MTQNNTVKAGIDDLNAKMVYYKVESTNNAVGDDGKKGHAGYAVINKETGVTEHASTLLPGVLFQAQHLDDMLSSLLQSSTTTTSGETVDLESVVDEDPVLN